MLFKVYCKTCKLNSLLSHSSCLHKRVSVVLSPEPFLITGDFNINVNVPNDSDAACFLELLTSMGLEQLADKPTHISGRMLDLIITRCSDSLFFAKPMTDYLSYYCSMRS